MLFNTLSVSQRESQKHACPLCTRFSESSLKEVFMILYKTVTVSTYKAILLMS